MLWNCLRKKPGTSYLGRTCAEQQVLQDWKAVNGEFIWPGTRFAVNEDCSKILVKLEPELDKRIGWACSRVHKSMLL